MRAGPVFLLALCAAAGRQGTAQSSYYNLDAGRPGRVEDAEPTPLYSLDLDPSSLQYERLTGGTSRFRAEPRVSYGAFPFTEIELRIPIITVDPPRALGSRLTTGLGGVGVGFLHAFSVETSNVPALAIAGEWLAPAGSLAGPVGSYSLKFLATKTTSIGRFHFNASGGTYSIRLSGSIADTSCSTLVSVRLAGSPCSQLPGGVIDAPCSVTTGRATGVSRFCMGPLEQIDSTPAARTSLAGQHWFAGVGYDHSFALSSTMITADLFAERFVGLYPRPDVSVETGVRRQVTPVMAVDAGGAWHFLGVLRSFSFTFGATYELATHPLSWP